MKKFNIIIIVLFLVVTLSCLTGCIKKDRMDNINVITSIYPIEYVANILYGDNSNIDSIYPRGSIPTSYRITSKQIKDFSEYDLFIYNGKSNEKGYATKMLNKNKNLKIIDASYGLDINYAKSDIWLVPSNILMIGQNIKNELEDYITDANLIKSIDERYLLLKIDITALESEMKKADDSSINPTIVVADDSFNFLEKYGFKVINLTDNGKNKESNIQVARSLFASGDLSYIYEIDHSKNYDIVNELKNTYKLDVLTLKKLDTISESDEQNNDDYISIMHGNLDLIKKETYK